MLLVVELSIGHTSSVIAPILDLDILGSIFLLSVPSVLVSQSLPGTVKTWLSRPSLNTSVAPISKGFLTLSFQLTSFWLLSSSRPRLSSNTSRIQSWALKRITESTLSSNFSVSLAKNWVNKIATENWQTVFTNHREVYNFVSWAYLDRKFHFYHY